MVLLREGANPRVRDGQSLTAEDHARRGGLMECAGRLAGYATSVRLAAVEARNSGGGQIAKLSGKQRRRMMRESAMANSLAKPKNKK